MQKTLELPKVDFITTPEGKPKSVILSIQIQESFSYFLFCFSIPYRQR